MWIWTYGREFRFWHFESSRMTRSLRLRGKTGRGVQKGSMLSEDIHVALARLMTGISGVRYGIPHTWTIQISTAILLHRSAMSFRPQLTREARTIITRAHFQLCCLLWPTVDTIQDLIYRLRCKRSHSKSVFDSNILEWLDSLELVKEYFGHLQLECILSTQRLHFRHLLTLVDMVSHHVLAEGGFAQKPWMQIPYPYAGKL